MKLQKQKEKITKEPKQISFSRLTFQALPEMWSFQILTALILALPASVLSRLITWTAESAGGAMTTANIKELLWSWRSPVLLLLGGFLIFWYTIMEIFVQIHMHRDVLQGRRAGILQEMGRGFRSFRKFLNPGGILILLYIFIAVPLCGVGFSISLSRTFYIPNFIMDVVNATPLYALAYTLLMAGLIWIGYRSLFSVHAILLDGMTPSQARKESLRIIKAHGRKFIWGMLKLLFLVTLILLGAFLLFNVLPYDALEKLGETLPRGYRADIMNFTDPSLVTDMDASVISYRILCCLAVLMGTYLDSVTVLLCGSFLMLRFTRYYLEFTGKTSSTWPERPRKSRYGWKFLTMIGIFLLVFLLSVLLGLFFHQIFERPEPVKIIAHRAGGVEASENSVQGLYAAMEYGCYGSEIDVQRTKDGFYIINHDNDFRRLTGIAKSPQDMTLEEIRELKIRDTTGSGALLPIVTIEEMLDVIKGKEKLYIELKGVTADRQMVDDLVRIIQEKDCREDVAFISLDYSIIDYAETNYPEFETGTLFFAGIGNAARLNCDLLIMEEQIATEFRIDQIHRAGKQAIVWTVNTAEGMYRFLDSSIDGVITDEIRLAEETRKRLEERTDLQIIRDKLGNIWE